MNKKNLTKFSWILSILILFLIALGGATRASDSGLACPDWPLCFGEFIPDYHPQVYYEYIHRVLAGLIGILTFIFGVFIFKSHFVSVKIKNLMVVAWILLLVQVVMGGLTVLLKLHFATVTTHLLLATFFFSCIFWTYMTLFHSDESGILKTRKGVPNNILYMSYFISFIVIFQIFLGGLVSSNYAGLACPDFPLCHGSWVPTLSGEIGLQVKHRFGAYFVALSIYIVFLIFNSKRAQSWMPFRVVKTMRMLVSMVLAQIALGVANIVFKIPALLSVLHLGLAVMIFAVTLRLIFILKYEVDTPQAA